MSGVSLVCWRDLFDSLDDHAIGEAARALSLSAQVLVQSSQVAQRTVLPINPTFRVRCLPEQTLGVRLLLPLNARATSRSNKGTFVNLLKLFRYPLGFTC